jgi:hypothetical protein
LNDLEDARSARLSWESASAPGTATARMLGDIWGDQLTRLGIDVSAPGPVGTLVWTLEAVPTGR